MQQAEYYASIDTILCIYNVLFIDLIYRGCLQKRRASTISERPIKIIEYKYVNINEYVNAR